MIRESRIRLKQRNICTAQVEKASSDAEVNLSFICYLLLIRYINCLSLKWLHRFISYLLLRTVLWQLYLLTFYVYEKKTSRIEKIEREIIS